jgi:thioredoxin 1
VRRRELLAAAAVLTVMLLPALATAQERYDSRAFKSAIASGPVVVHVSAEWCLVCRAQKPILAALAKERQLASAKFVNVDFDKDREFLKTYRVANQSVILVFKNGQEVTRLAGTTDAAKIRSGVLGAL